MTGIKNDPLALHVRVQGLCIQNKLGSCDVKRPGETATPYFPIQKVEKMRFRMSSAVVAPVKASSGRSEA